MQRGIPALRFPICALRSAPEVLNIVLIKTYAPRPPRSRFKTFECLGHREAAHSI